jgi:ABC-type uncharacterized transport system involved in gliding motility auxiliary subunit
MSNSQQIVATLMNMRPAARNQSIRKMVNEVPATQQTLFRDKLMQRLLEKVIEQWTAELTGEVPRLMLLAPNVLMEEIMEYPDDIQHALIDWFVDQYGQGTDALKRHLHALRDVYASK